MKLIEGAIKAPFFIPIIGDTMSLQTEVDIAVYKIKNLMEQEAVENELTTPLARQKMTQYRGCLQNAIKALESLQTIENNYTKFHEELYGKVFDTYATETDQCNLVGTVDSAI